MRLESENKQNVFTDREKEIIVDDENFLSEYSSRKKSLNNEWWKKEDEVMLALEIQEFARSIARLAEDGGVDLPKGGVVQMMGFNRLSLVDVRGCMLSRYQIILVSEFLVRELLRLKPSEILEWSQSCEDEGVCYECRFEGVTTVLFDWLNAIVQCDYPLAIEWVEWKRMDASDVRVGLCEFSVSVRLDGSPTYKGMYEKA